MSIVEKMADQIMAAANAEKRAEDEFCTYSMAMAGAVKLLFDYPGLCGLTEAQLEGLANETMVVVNAVSLAEVAEQNNDCACLSPEEQKAQGSRCGCLGADDYCVCQNVPDKKTLEARKAMIGAAHD